MASEVAPFIKTGGLADVAGALPKALKEQHVDVRVVLPEYSQIPSQFLSRLEHLGYFYINVSWRREYVGINRLKLEGITYYFIDNKTLFHRETLYENSDRALQFTYFSRAVLAMLKKIDFKPKVIHCNDWQTGLIPFYLKEEFSHDPFYASIKTLFTIHNLQYQGQFSKDILEDVMGVSKEFNVEIMGDHVNFMRLGILYADKVTTVSPTYAQEILTPYYGEGLEAILTRRYTELVGIINGIDTVDFNPETDKELYKQFTTTSLSFREENKKKLQENLGLTQDATRPMIALITRLADQKGLDLVQHVFSEMMHLGVQVVLLGSGDSKYVEFFQRMQHYYPHQFSLSMKFDAELAKQIYAGCDFFLMPSRFEPCGLGQLLAMRYGAIPIVRETGGLCDTVFAYQDDTTLGNGFTFKNYNAHDMLYTIERAVHYYRTYPDIIDRLRKRGLESDFSWTRSAQTYRLIYEKL